MEITLQCDVNVMAYLGLEVDCRLSPIRLASIQLVQSLLKDLLKVR